MMSSADGASNGTGRDTPNKRKREPDESEGRRRPKVRERVTVDDEFLADLVKFAKKNRPRALTPVERLDILLLQAYLRNEHHKSNGPEGSTSSTGLGRRAGPPKVSETVAKVFRRKSALVKEIWADYVQENSLKVAPLPGNSAPRKFKIPDTRVVTNKVLEFIQKRQVNRTRTVAKDVMTFLSSQDFLSYNTDDAKSTAAALRNVQRFLRRKGFRHGSKKGAQNYRLKTENIIKRDKFVGHMVEAKKMGHQRVVYVGESYLYRDYERNESSPFDPNDEQDLAVASQQASGNLRMQFIGAIIDDDTSVPESQRVGAQEASFLQETLLIWGGGTKATKVNHEFIEGWMRGLLSVLRARGDENVLIVMNDTKLNKELPEDTPRFDWKKEKLLKACERFNISVPADTLKSVVWDLLREQVAKQVQPVVCTMAAAQGHRVLFVPPHHFNLQPIEGVWGIVKGAVGRQHTPGNSIQEVQSRFRTAVGELRAEQVRKCIAEADQHLMALHDSIKLIDTGDEPADYDFDDDEDDDDDNDEDEDLHYDDDHDD